MLRSVGLLAMCLLLWAFAPRAAAQERFVAIPAAEQVAQMGTGVNILVVGTSFDDVARAAVADTASKYLLGAGAETLAAAQ